MTPRSAPRLAAFRFPVTGLLASPHWSRCTTTRSTHSIHPSIPTQYTEDVTFSAPGRDTLKQPLPQVTTSEIWTLVSQGKTQTLSIALTVAHTFTSICTALYALHYQKIRVQIPHPPKIFYFYFLFYFLFLFFILD